jgi:hypothetical protein
MPPFYQFTFEGMEPPDQKPEWLPSEVAAIKAAAHIAAALVRIPDAEPSFVMAVRLTPRQRSQR